MDAPTNHPPSKDTQKPHAELRVMVTNAHAATSLALWLRTTSSLSSSKAQKPVTDATAMKYLLVRCSGTCN